MLVKDFAWPLRLVFRCDNDVGSFGILFSHSLHFGLFLGQLFDQSIDCLLQADHLGCDLLFFLGNVEAGCIPVAIARYWLSQMVGCSWSQASGAVGALTVIGTDDHLSASVGLSGDAGHRTGAIGCSSHDPCTENPHILFPRSLTHLIFIYRLKMIKSLHKTSNNFSNNHPHLPPLLLNLFPT